MPLVHLDFTENLLNLAAVIYRPEDDVDALLLSFARSLQREGRRLGGVVQRNWRNECGPARLMAVVDLMTERQIPICQDLGSGSGACQLDEASLADAAQAVRRAVASDVELVIVNKFGKTEAEGRGLRSEIAEAILASKPVLTAVSTRIYPAWQSFTGSFGTMLICDESIVRGWWQDIAQKIDRRRLGLPAAVRSMT